MVREEDWIWKLKSSHWWINSVNECVCCNWNSKGNVEGWQKFWRTFLWEKWFKRKHKGLLLECFSKREMESSIISWQPGATASCDHSPKSVELWPTSLRSPLQTEVICTEQLSSEAAVVCRTGCYKQPKHSENSRKFHRVCLSFHWFGLPGSRGVGSYVVSVNFVNLIQKGMCWCRKKSTNIRWPSQSAITLQRFFWLQVLFCFLLLL